MSDNNSIYTQYRYFENTESNQFWTIGITDGNKLLCRSGIIGQPWKTENIPFTNLEEELQKRIDGKLAEGFKEMKTIKFFDPNFKLTVQNHLDKENRYEHNITHTMLLNVYEIETDGGDDLFFDEDGDDDGTWDGEDGQYDVTSIVDVVHLPNLKAIQAFWYDYEEATADLEKRGIECIDM